MKKYLFILTTAIIAVICYAQMPVLKSKVLTPWVPKTQVQTLSGTVKSVRIVAPGALKAPRHAESDYVVITEQPAGELKTFHRTGSYLYVQDQSLYIGAQSGNVDIVFGDEGAIYIKDPLMGAAYGSWVSGKYDKDGGKVTISVPQNLVYVSNYDVCVALVPIDSYSTADFTAQDITYTVSTSDAGEMVLTLDGFTDYNRTLGGGWTDDQTIQVYGEYLTVLTEGEEVAPEVVVAPEGAEFKEYALSGTDYSGNAYSGTAFIAIVDNDVYLKGYSSYIPDALIKGVKDGNTVTFPADQYLGNLSGSDFYFLPTQYGGQDAVFAYDATTDTYTCTGEVFTLYDGYIDTYVLDPVLKGVTEKAVMPANPSITELKFNSSYGYYINFTVPNTDVDGDGLVASLLSYQLFTDVEHEVTPLTFTPATHSQLTEDMSVIPFTFTDNYDFEAGRIWLNDLYSDTWNKIGIKSIYTGGGVTNETEIQWYTIKPYALDNLLAEITTAEALLANESYKTGQTMLTEAINAAKAVAENADATPEEVEAATQTLKDAEAEFKAVNTAYNNLQAAIDEATALKDSEEMAYGKDALNSAITKATRVLNNADATTETLNDALAALQEALGLFKEVNGYTTAMWDARQQGYGATEVVESAQLNEDLTLTLSKGEASTAPTYYSNGTSLRVYYKNTFTITAAEGVTAITKIVIGQSGTSYGTELTANVGELTKSGSTLTWVGNATEVVFTNFIEGGTNTQTRIRTITVDYIKADQLVTLPETAEVQTWTLSGQTVGSSTSTYDFPTEVAFDGDDIYVKGLFPYSNDTWAKGTLADGKATFAAGQLIADSPEYGEKYYLLGSADGETVSDFVLAYDAEAKTLTQETEYIYINYLMKNSINPEYLESWKNLLLTFGIEEPVTPPADLVAETWTLNTAFDYDEEELDPYEAEVQVGFDGDDAYIQGIAPNAPLLWIKATKSADGTYTVPSMQFMGEISSWFKRKYYITALGDDGAFADLVFTYDDAAKVFTTSQKFVLSMNKRELNALQTFNGTTTIAAPKTIVEGDANGDSEVTTSDAVLAVSFALEIEVPTEDQFIATDVNKDQEITVSDAVGIVNIALDIDATAEPAGARQLTGNNSLSWNGSTLCLSNDVSFVAFQVDVTLADGATLNGVQLAERAQSLNVLYNKVGDNTWRILAISMAKNTIQGNSGALLTLDIAGATAVNIEKAEFTDAAARAYNLSGVATGISSLSSDADTAGEVYGLNGVRSNSPVKGVNIVRQADGTVKKVLK